MALLVADCPRCGANSITFDAVQAVHTVTEYHWQRWYEVFCICRRCRRSTVFVLSNKMGTEHEMINDKGILSFDSALNGYMDVERYVSLRDAAPQSPPEHLPKQIEAAFKEAAVCLSVDCFNAAGTMFRLCIDLSTQPLLPEEDSDGLNARVRRSLGLRLEWLFERKMLPEPLRPLSTCIKDDGNDAAHRGNLTKDDAEDLLDFSVALLERLHTEPERLRLAEERRKERRAPAQ